jgi:hypothetical protein
MALCFRCLTTLEVARPHYLDYKRLILIRNNR